MKTQSPSCSKLEHSTPDLNQSLSILLGGEIKLGKQVNKKLLYRDSDLLDVGLVVQKAKKLRYSTVIVGFNWILKLTNSPTLCK